MSEENNKIIIAEAVIASKIFTIREEKVILDVHLAELYEVDTRSLKQAVRRNRDRFPSDFMYELTDTEVEYVVSQNVIPSKSHLGGAVPFAFTDNGVAMLSSVLKSKRAIVVNIAIMKTFTLLRKMLLIQKDVKQEIIYINNKLSNHDEQIMLLFDYLEKLEEVKHQEQKHQNRKKIGFKNTDEE